MSTSTKAGGRGAPGKKRRIESFLLDLTTIEVNTLVTDNISGESMGDPQEAIADLRSRYASKLGAIAGGDGGASTRAFAAPGKRGGRAESMDFRDQRRVAEELIAGQTGLAAGDQGHLDRIRANCGFLDRLSDKLVDAEAEPAGPARTRSPAPRAAAGKPASTEDADDEVTQLSPKEMVALRKMWELGTEPIAFQSVIQAGGDMITRVHPDYATGTHQPLLELHRSGVETAIRVWSSLVDTAVLILEKLFDR